MLRICNDTSHTGFIWFLYVQWNPVISKGWNISILPSLVLWERNCSNGSNDWDGGKDKSDFFIIFMHEVKLYFILYFNIAYCYLKDKEMKA